MGFQIQIQLFLFLSFIGIIYGAISLEGEKCCAAIYVGIEKTACEDKIDEGYETGLLPLERRGELIKVACKIVGTMREPAELSAAQFGFLVSLGKTDISFYADFIIVFPPDDARDIIFNLPNSQALVRHNLYSLTKAMNAGGARFWQTINKNHIYYLEVLKTDPYERYKNIVLDNDFQIYYHHLIEWSPVEMEDCFIKYLFDSFFLNSNMLRNPVVSYKRNAIEGLKVYCTGYHDKNRKLLPALIAANELPQLLGPP